jgi:hypothetical protein
MFGFNLDDDSATACSTGDESCLSSDESDSDDAAAALLTATTNNGDATASAERNGSDVATELISPTTASVHDAAQRMSKSVKRRRRKRGSSVAARTSHAACHCKLQDIGDIPASMRGNPYITRAYREFNFTTVQAFTSMFRLHNETLCIWSHFLPFLCFIGRFCLLPFTLAAVVLSFLLSFYTARLRNAVK